MFTFEPAGVAPNPDQPHPSNHSLIVESEPAAVDSWSEKEMKPRQLLDGKAVQKEKRTQVLCCAQNAQHEL